MDDSKLQDFPWDKEAAWMEYEATARMLWAQGALPLESADDFIERLRTAFDALFSEFQTPPIALEVGPFYKAGMSFEEFRSAVEKILSPATHQLCQTFRREYLAIFNRCMFEVLLREVQIIQLTKSIEG
jgi:hypothetical protein